MSRLIILTLTDEERAALEKGFRSSTSHAFRTRCRMILLKADRLPSIQIAPQVGCCMMSVNGWVKRYQQEGIAGLETKPGRGRKAILDDQTDLEQVRPISNRCGRPCRPTARRSASPKPSSRQVWARSSALRRSSAS